MKLIIFGRRPGMTWPNQNKVNERIIEAKNNARADLISINYKNIELI